MQKQLTNLILAHKHAPGAAAMGGTTRPLRLDLILNGDTLARNILEWREKRELNEHSVVQSYQDVLSEARKQFPVTTDINTALQMRRWKKRLTYLEDQRED